jgi:hypothetical protein
MVFTLAAKIRKIMGVAGGRGGGEFVGLFATEIFSIFITASKSAKK